MKPLLPSLLLLSLLLLNSPLFGQETGVLYQYETSTGIKWKTFGDGKVQPNYKGEIKKGKMDGLGVLTYPYDEKSVLSVHLLVLRIRGCQLYKEIKWEI